MPVIRPLPVTAEDYDRAADDYLQMLPLEHFAETTPQATQRLTTIFSFALLQALRSMFQFFNELLVQHRVGDELVQVVPDNMAILSDEPERPRTSYATELERAAPFWVLEYVSASSKRKDYDDSFHKYEQQLRVPYCLFFYPEKQDLRLYRHDGTRYERMEPDLQGRMPIPELELEVGLWQGWVRYWYRGHLLEVPAESAAKLHQKDRQIHQLDQRIQELLDRLRRQVSRRAQKENRSDILTQLPTATEEQLERWLEELS